MKIIKQFDFLIAGSGFGGSVLAMCLAQSGYGVCLVEKGSHPRFAVGESSTPIADMILRDLADRYKLHFLKEISRYGEWQRHHPEVICGLKRGFSYYPHSPGEEFESNPNHKNELLVAASSDDENSDTNWLRSDVDSFLIQQVKDLAIDYLEMTEITQLTRSGDSWDISLRNHQDKVERHCSAKWIIDATGSSAFSETFFGTRSSASGFHTRSSAVYSHFQDAGRWLDHLNESGFYTDDYPYNPDHSALHQLIDEGWIWMLRFNNDLLSAGIVLDESDRKESRQESPEKLWNRIISAYPSVSRLFRGAVPAAEPGGLIRSGRLQRRLDRMYGEGWVTLNHTAGFVDPLHSTGIAHTLCGVEKLAALFTDDISDQDRIRKLAGMEQTFYRELELIDLLVSSCYLTRKHFDLFTAAVMLYFAATITYEQGRINGEKPAAFLCADRKELYSMVIRFQAAFRDANRNGNLSGEYKNRLISEVKRAIEPYNSVGLMDPKRNNMYSHTAVRL